MYNFLSIEVSSMDKKLYIISALFFNTHRVHSLILHQVHE